MVSLKSYQTDEIALNVYEACARKVSAEPRRGYLGMSRIGHPCERALWLDLNQAERAPFEGRVARIFANGHLREDTIIADLEAAGYPIDGKQTEFSDFGGKFSGHRDGVIHNITKQPHLLEIKTANDANFKAFVKNGVKQKPEYWAQMQCYMGYGGQERGLFVVENKNNQELYTERVKFDSTAFEELKAKAKRVIEATTPPEKPEDESGCYWCQFKNFGCLNPPEAQAAQPPAKEGCHGCIHYWPKESGREGADAIIQSLRLAITYLGKFYKEIPSEDRKSFESLVADALNLRPDFNVPLEILYCSKKPVERFKKILEYALARKNGLCDLTYMDSSDPIKMFYQGLPAKNDWCRHPSHAAKIFQPVGCGDHTAEEVPF